VAMFSRASSSRPLRVSSSIYRSSSASLVNRPVGWNVMTVMTFALAALSLSWPSGAGPGGLRQLGEVAWASPMQKGAAP